MSDEGAPSPSRRRAFTLIEVVAATALTALLLSAVLATIRSLARDHAVAAAPGQPVDDAGVEAALCRLVEQDLLNASSVVLGRGRLTVVGRSDEVMPHADGGQRETVVVYGVEDAGGRRWLVRRRAVNSARSGRRWTAELVCADVASFQVEPLWPPASSSGDVSAPGRGGVARGYRVLLVWAGPRPGPAIDRTFVVR